MQSAPNPQPGWGILWMILTGLQFVGVTAFVKLTGTRIPAVEAAFLRYVLGLVFLLPLLGALARMRTSRGTWGLFLARGAAHSMGVGLWFYAMARIPIADVVAMNYLNPIYVTLGAALFFKEKLALRRILAVLVALLGALIILRPGFREVGAGHLAMIFTAIAFGGSYLLAKILADRCSPGLVVAMLSITVTIALAPVALSVWVTPTLYELTMLAAVACFATGGHYTMTLAFRAAPLTVTQPVTFLQLVWAVLVGMVFFNEPFDPFVILGGLVIVSAVTFISWREAVLKRRAMTPVSTATKV
ncbi:DMT family transporter [Roseovarius aestuariivivens]|uniref:DMT family transporter n=1 Tax=Roseovarius aestuariivivens TaxID=1888910 RepID=UPI001FDA9357|nr:DMT family transporter [Roseovarius aestuariivivens]